MMPSCVHFALPCRPMRAHVQNVTLGGTGKEVGDRHPKISDNVLIGASATVLGNITVGRGAQIAAGSLVLKPVPPHTMVAGSPAQPVGKLFGEQEPAWVGSRLASCAHWLGTALWRTVLASHCPPYLR